MLPEKVFRIVCNFMIDYVFHFFSLLSLGLVGAREEPVFEANEKVLNGHDRQDFPEKYIIKQRQYLFLKSI